MDMDSEELTKLEIIVMRRIELKIFDDVFLKLAKEYLSLKIEQYNNFFQKMFNNSIDNGYNVRCACKNAFWLTNEMNFHNQETQNLIRLYVNKVYCGKY